MIETIESRIADSQPLLISICKRIHQRLPKFILYEDVMSCGQLGLLQAAQTYIPQPGAKFSTYAYYRISGAVFDGLSRMNWTTRAEYRKYKAAQMANHCLDPIDKPLQPAESASSEQDARWFSDSVENLSVVYLFSASDPENPVENQLLSKDDDPGTMAETNELKELLRTAISSLPPDEQKLIRLAYFEDFSLAEAAQQLGKSRSWGSRTHARILSTLKTKLIGSKVEN